MSSSRMKKNKVQGRAGSYSPPELMRMSFTVPEPGGAVVTPQRWSGGLIIADIE